ncbi:MAG: molybdenum cofactor guanylyltransferase [Hydrogenibacillus sp.]|nr:molybdenum cofactor guanylyltransferase [Hydrogenibacillus sp.]
MGRNKAFLPIGGKPNIERLVETLAPYFSDVCLVTNEPETYAYLGIPMDRDVYPGLGPLAGVHAGLLLARAPVVFVVANDMPFVTPEVALRLIELSEGYDAAVPVVSGKAQPLCAVYKKDMASQFEAALRAGKRRVIDAYEHMHVRLVTEKELRLSSLEANRLFFNMNTPEEYEQALKWTSAPGLSESR